MALNDAGDLINLSVASGLADEGGTLLQEIPEAARVEETWDVDEGWSCVVEVPVSSPAISAISHRRVLWLEGPIGTIREYRIGDLEDGRSGASDTLVVRGQDPIVDWAERAIWTQTLSTGGVLFDGGIGDATPTEILTGEILPGLQAAGIAVALGVIEPDLTLSLRWQGPVNFLELLEQLVAAIRQRGLLCERDYTRDVGTGYEIHLLREIGDSGTTPELHVGRHLGPWKRKRSARELVSRSIPFGGVDASGGRATIANAAWRVSAVNGGANQVTLVDPQGGPGPVQFTDQHDTPEGPWFLEAADGTLAEVTASARTSETDSLLTLTGVSAFAVDDEVVIRENGTGKPLTSLVHPTRILAPPTGIGEKLVPLDQPQLRGERNLVPNPWMAQWAVDTDPPDGWTVGTAGTPQITKVTNPAHTQLGGAGLRINAFYSNAGFFDVYSPPFRVRPVATYDPFTLSLSLFILGAGGDLQIQVGTWITEIANADLVIGRRWDVTISGITFPRTPSGLVTVALRRGGASIGGIDFIWDAVQFTQTPGAADAWFVGSRANALHQAGNRHLLDYNDPPPNFEGTVEDYERLDPGQWAHLALEPGVTSTVEDAERGLSFPVRVVRLTRNRLIKGDTRVGWASRLRSTASLAAGSVSIGEVPMVPAPIGPPGSPTLPPNTDTNPTTSTSVGLQVNRYPIYAGAATLQITNYPSADTEWTQARQWLFLGAAERARLTGKVITALTGAKIRAQYWHEGASEWRGLDGGSGPVLSLSATGDVRSEDVTIQADARGDVLVRFLRYGGDDAGDPEVGNLMLEVHRGPQLLRPEDAGCGLSGFTVQGDDFAGGNAPLPVYADMAELATYVGSGAANRRRAYWTDLGLTAGMLVHGQFNNRPTVDLRWGPGAYQKGWSCEFSDDGVPTETLTPHDDVWVRIRLAIDDGFAVDTDPPTPTPGTGLQLIYLEGTSSGNVAAALCLREGKLWLLTSNSSTAAELDLGAEAIVGSGFNDLIVRVCPNGADTDVRAWAGAACATGLVRLGDATFTENPNQLFDRAYFVLLSYAFDPGVHSDQDRWIRIADWEVVPASVDTNPFSVSDP